MESAVLQTCMTFITSIQLIVWYVPFLKLQPLGVPPNSSIILTMSLICIGHCVAQLDETHTKTLQTKLLSMGGDEM